MDTAVGGASAAAVLVVGGDRLLLGLARAALPPPAYRLRTAPDAGEAVGALFAQRPDVVVVTSRPDGQDGTASCRELQAIEDVPVIVLVPSSTTEGAVRALTCADDYVALPVAPEELRARVQAVLRRATGRRPRGEPVYDDGRLRLEFQNRTASLGGGPLHLTPTEYRLLTLLASNPRRLFTQAELLRRIWGEAYAGDAHLLRLHVANLRAKLGGRDGHAYIRTQRGLGYTFQPARPLSPEPADGGR